jgi:hypothetical protein
MDKDAPDFITLKTNNKRPKLAKQFQIADYSDIEEIDYFVLYCDLKKENSRLKCDYDKKESKLESKVVELCKINEELKTRLKTQAKKLHWLEKDSKVLYIFTSIVGRQPLSRLNLSRLRESNAT